MKNESVTDRESDDENPRGVVLYCPACAGEYPLTFSECPVHGVRLAKHARPTPWNRGANARSVAGNNCCAMPSQIEGSQRETAQAKGNIDSELESPQNGMDRTTEALGEVDDASSERPGFRIAAVATVIALVLFAVVSLYGLVSHLSRQPTSTVARVASPTDVDAQPLPFVATPQEAQDYREEQPSPEASAPSKPQSGSPGERKNGQTNSPTSIDQNVRKTTIGQASLKPSIATPRSQPERMTVSTPQAPVQTRGNSGGFDSRLVRARGTRTSSGYRYDLTFNMLEQAGRSAQWQRVLISARSASGTNRTAAVPFVHRLGAAGALTFTISVELTGRSEADWRGRVVCTALGWDNAGAPLQASFGANVTP